MDLLDYFLVILFLTFTVLNTKKAVRAFVTGKKAGILKVRIDPVPAIICSVVCIVAVAVSSNRFSTAKEYRDRANSYERILGISDNAVKDMNNYRQLSSSSDSRAKYEETIRKLRANAKTMSDFGWYTVLLGANSLALIFVSILYFTEEGIVTGNMKVPEPVTAVLHDGKINVSIAADTHKNKAVWSFKKTPQNLAAFGRFIEWDAPETDAAEQDVPPLDSSGMPT